MKLVKNSQGLKPLHHKGVKVRLRLVTRTLGLGQQAVQISKAYLR